MFLGEVLCRAGGGPLEPEYVINLIGGRSISMENAVSGPKTPRGPFPLVPHCAISANAAISPVRLYHPQTLSFVLLLSPVTAARPSHVLYPAPAQSSRRPNGHARSLTVGNLISLSRATKSRDPDSATWLSPSYSHHALHPLFPPLSSVCPRQSPPLFARRPICLSQIQCHLPQRITPSERDCRTLASGGSPWW